MQSIGKKSQAALEFLATYGWAFLVLLIMIATLAYFGILSPSSLLPDRCNFGSEIGCVNYVIEDNGVNLKMKNNVGEPIIISGISVSTEKTALSCNSAAVGTGWLAGEVKDIGVLCDFTDAGITAGQKGKLNLKLSYYPSRSGSSYIRDVSGELYSTVQGSTIPGGGSAAGCTLSALPSSGSAPLSGTLSWTTSNSPTSCTASNGWSGAKSVSGGSEPYGPISSTTTYTLTCTNSVGSGQCSAVVTIGAAPDTTPPTVSITAPASGPVPPGTVAVSATATDNVAVASVQFKVDGNNLGAADTTAPYSINWDTTTVSNGNHDLTAVATDTSNNPTTSSPVTVTVNNPVSFDFSLSNGGDKAVTQGSSVDNGITATYVSGTTQSVSFSASVSGSPAGVTTSFLPSSCSPTCPTTLTIQTTAATPAGTYTVTVTGTAGSITRQTIFQLTVNLVSDTTPPVRSNGLPTGTLPAGTTQTTLSLTTDEASTCKYSTTANTAYSSMTNTFSTTGSTSHSTNVAGLTDGQTYNYYIRCQDVAGNANTNDFTITFSVASVWTFCASEGGSCSFAGNKEVRYGANGNYCYRIFTGGTPCTNAVFGDPIVGTAKQCNFRDTTTQPGFVGQWKFDEASGCITVADSSGNGHNGAVTGATVTSGKLNNARNFAGGTDVVVVNSVGVDTSAGGKNTVAFWMNWDGTNGIMPFGWNTAYDLWFSSLCFGFNTGQGNVFGISSSSLSNTWVHVAAVFYNGVPSATNNELYINGVKQTISSCVGSTTASRSATTTVYVSGWGPDTGYKFRGKIDDVRIYNRALTSSEVQTLYNGGAGQP